MKPFVLFAAGAALLAFFAFSLAQNQPARPAAGAPAPQAALRITFGERQDRETDYSGSLTLSDGRVTELIPWRFFGEDRLDGVNAWKLFLRRANMENQPDQPRPLSNLGQTPNIVPKGVSAVLDAPATADATIRTQRGAYTFRLDALRGGRVLQFEEGDVTVQSVPAPVRITAARPPNVIAEHDYPSLSMAPGGAAWVAWQVYENGGDRVLASHSELTPNGPAWSAAEPLTPAGQDIFRTATAQDARGRVWVVWSEREGEAWNLVARTHDGSAWGAPRKLTNGNGPNFFHRLVRDRAGNLHLVWVAHPGAESHVMWSKLAGDTWSAPQEISGANAWMPDAAADSQGNLWVAWDSYRTGTTASSCAGSAWTGSLERSRWDRSNRSPPPRAFRRTLRWPWMAAAACGWPGKRAARTGAKTTGATTPGPAPLYMPTGARGWPCFKTASGGSRPIPWPPCHAATTATWKRPSSPRMAQAESGWRSKRAPSRP